MKRTAAAVETNNLTRWLVLAGVWLLYFSFGLNLASLAPLVTFIEADLQMSHSAMGVVLGVWQLVYIVASVPCGILIDRVGSRYAFTAGALLIAVSAIGRSVAGDYVQLLLAVGAFGLGGPIISAGAPKMIAGWFRGRERGLAMGIYITGFGVGSILSLTLTNSILMPWFNEDWRLVLRFWGLLTVLTGAVWFVISWLPAVRDGKHTPIRIEGELVMPLLRLRSVQLVLLMSVGVLFFTHGLSNWMPELLRSGGMSVNQASLWAALPVVVAIAGALVIPRLASREHRYRVLLLLFLCAIGASVLLRVALGPVLVTGLILDGIARSSMTTVLILTLVETRGIGEERAGSAAGLYFSVAEIGGVAGPVMLGVLYDATGDFSAGLGLLTAVSMLLVVALGFLKKHTGLS